MLRIDCVSVLEGMEIPGYGDELRRDLSYGTGIVWHIRKYLNTQKCLICFGLHVERKKIGGFVDEEEAKDLFERATTRWCPTDDA